MNFFRKKKKETSTRSVTVQTRTTFSHPFQILDSYVPKNAEYELYRIMREAVPVIDTAINRLTRLIGEFDIDSTDEQGKALIEEFLKDVKVGAFEKGIYAFINNYFDQLLENGSSVGEIVLDKFKEDIYALQVVDIDTIELKQMNNRLDYLICQKQEMELEPVELPYQNLMLYTPLSPEKDSPYGVSLLRSMPFVTGILLTVFNSTKLNWERFGNLMFSVTCDLPKDLDDSKVVEEMHSLLKTEWNKVMDLKSKGKAADIVGVGNLKVSVIGADAPVLESEIPVRQLLEQIIAKTGLPPFLLGISWSSTERMSQQQADFLTSEIEHYRTTITPVINKVIDTWLAVKGLNISYEINWQDVNLQDMVEIARADLMKEQAKEKKINNLLTLRDQNIINQNDVANELGYDNAVGEPPAPVEIDPLSLTYSKKKEIRHYEGCECTTKDLLSDPNPDPEAYQIELKWSKDFSDILEETEKKIVDIVKDSEKNYKKHKVFEELEKVEAIISVSGIKLDGAYKKNLKKAWNYGCRRANKTANEEITQEDRDLEEIEIPKSSYHANDYEHPYIQMIRYEGLQRVEERKEIIRENIREILIEGASEGKNPMDIARLIHNELGGKRWDWERLARSECSIALDKADFAEYSTMNIPYEQWSAAPDACAPICKPLDKKWYKLGEGPEVVYDTHPNCRCRKKPRSLRQYLKENG